MRIPPHREQTKFGERAERSLEAESFDRALLTKGIGDLEIQQVRGMQIPILLERQPCSLPRSRVVDESVSHDRGVDDDQVLSSKLSR